MPGIKEYSDEEKQRATAFCKGLLHAVFEVWPRHQHALMMYFEGVPATVAIVDRYYRDYLQGEIPRPLRNRFKNSERLNLVVLSESHARSNPALVGLSIHKDWYHLVPEAMRKGHVNLVHCLSYGEPWLLSGKDDISPDAERDNGAKSGTPDFWKLLTVLAGLQGTCLSDKVIEAKERKNNRRRIHPGTELDDNNWDEAFALVDKANTKDPEERVRNKVKILKRLQQRKVELLDISPVHIYLASGTAYVVNKTTGNVYDTKRHDMTQTEKHRVLRASWDHYTQPLLNQWRPRNIFVLGTTLLAAPEDQKRLEALCLSIGAKNRGAITHPSVNKTKPVRNRDMNKVRTVVNEAILEETQPVRYADMSKVRIVVNGAPLKQTLPLRNRDMNKVRAVADEAVLKKTKPLRNKDVNKARTVVNEAVRVYQNGQVEQLLPTPEEVLELPEMVDFSVKVEEKVVEFPEMVDFAEVEEAVGARKRIRRRKALAPSKKPRRSKAPVASKKPIPSTIRCS